MKSKLRKYLSMTLCVIFLFALMPAANAVDEDPPADEGTQALQYEIETEVFDWGEGVSKIHIDMKSEIPEGSINTETFEVTAKGYKYSEYVDDGDGGFTVVEKTEDFIREVTAVEVNGSKVTLVLENEYGFLGPKEGHGVSYAEYLVEQLKPIELSDTETISVGDKTYSSSRTFNTLVDAFEAGRYVCDYTFEGENPWTKEPETTKVTGLDYRLYKPQAGEGQAALIVWMHGGGEGGSDNRIQITANNVMEWSKEKYQNLFDGGAYVLALQAPTAWGPAYNEAVLGAIKEIIATNNIDSNRVYIGGCSMGGLGTWLAIIEEPELFAAAFPICPAYLPTAAELKVVKNLPIWIINATEDGTMAMAAGAYNGLKAQGSENIYISQFSEVNLDGNPYIPHFVWVYVHNDFSEATDGEFLYDEEDEIVYDDEEYPDGWICEDSFSPEDLGYGSFKAWLADQERPAPKIFDVTLECFDWGQNVTTITIDMGVDVSGADITADTFEVSAMGLSYFDWGQFKDITANFPRIVESVEVDGQLVTLKLTTNFSEGTAAGNGFSYYKVVQTKDIGDIKARSIAYTQDEVFEPLVDQFLERTYAPETKNELNYRLFVPEAPQYRRMPINEDGYPLVLWLHGAGEGGSDNHAQITANRVTAWIEPEAQEIFGGAFIMAPQNHQPAKTLGALNELLEEYNGTNGKPKIDRNRLYIGGCSMGGAGTWNTILEAPDMFAAAFPICPASTPTTAQLETLYYMPIWLIHSITDNTCNVSNSITAYNRLKKIGGDNIHMTLFNDVAFDTLPEEVRAALGHWSWVYVHNNFPYEYANEYTLHNDEDGTGVNFTAYGGVDYTNVNSELPSDLGDEYETFMHWLAAQSLDNDVETDVNFNLESVTYDWGEGLTRVHLHMRDEIDPESVAIDTFEVTAKNYKYMKYEPNDNGGFTPTPVIGDFVRPVTKVEVSGKKITLTLGCNFNLFEEDGDGMAFESYEILQKKDIETVDDVTLSGLAFVGSGDIINVLLDSFAEGRFVSDEHAATYTPRGSEEEKTLNYIDYRLYSPNTRDKVPLVVWLHGGGETGTDNRIQLAANRVPAWIEPEAQDIFGGAAYVLAPQTSIGWGQNYAAMVIALIEDIVANNNIDPERIYIGGCSMGGMGTWTMIQEAPELFAAAFPICGGTSASGEVMKTLVDMPIWMIHSVDDSTVNVSGSLTAYDMLIELGSKKVHMTLFKGVEIDNVLQDILGHWSWVYVHNNFPYESMEDQILHNAEDGTGVSFADAKDVEYTDINSELPADHGYDTFMEWLAAQLTPADKVSGNSIKLEAEDAKLKGASVFEETAVRVTNQDNKVTFRFGLLGANRYDVIFRLAPTGATARTDVATVYINGVEQDVSFDMAADSVGVYSNYVIKNVDILKGENVIEVIIAGEQVQQGWSRVFTGYATIDYLLLDRYVPYVPPVTPDEPDEDEPEVPQFYDITNHWAEDYINTVAAAGLFNGTSEHIFSPERNMTRAMFVTVLGRMAGINPDEVDETNKFEDVPNNTWYTEYVTWAALNGIVKGKTAITFDPEGNITREELATMIYRYLVKFEYELDMLEDIVPFADIDLVSDWATDAVTYVQNTGIISGRPGNLFVPQDNATRAEVATVMARLLELLDID